jgi:predicted ABC-type ATPase
MREVKSRGWLVVLIYIGIDNPNINVLRVGDRVELGGHDVPKFDILRRYDRSLANLSKVAKIVDSHSERLCQRLILYDNSTDVRHQLVATIEGNEVVTYMQELPSWVDRAILNL